METKMSRQGRLRMAATLICVACASAAGAQLASDGGNNLPHPRTQAASCAEVAWDKGLLALYPQIGDGCQEVVIAEGLKWARFEAELVRVYGDGRVTLDFKDRQGRSIEPISLLPASGQRVSIEGRTYQIKDVPLHQKLNVYLPEGIFAVATEPGAPPEELAEIVPRRAEFAQVQRRAATGPLPAQVNPTPRQTSRTLPDTAGPLPLLALAGLLS